MKLKSTLIILAIVVIALCIIPFALDVDNSYFVFFLFLSFVYIIIAQSWNIVGGYAGQISLGQHAFFGLGAYTTGMLWHHNLLHFSNYYFNPVVMILSGLVPVVLAIIIGFPLLSRLRGDYFALGTLGVGEIIKVIFIKGGDITGGVDGIHLKSSQFSSMSIYYWVGLFLAIGVTVFVYVLIHSRVGLALKAIREDEDGAAARGIGVFFYKMVAFGLAAFIAGVGGSLYAYYLFHINPEAVLKLDWTLYPILMVVMGGGGTIFGPVIGAFFMTGVFTLANIYFAQINPIIAGLMIILVMRFMPGGLIGLVDRLRGKGRA